MCIVIERAEAVYSPPHNAVPPGLWILGSGWHNPCYSLLTEHKDPIFGIFLQSQSLLS
ncbi:hypothetical protein KPSA1_01674 [Pseudomonas syringae pv. actinidiae]|uniref:Uncharacterized protein n=1 Tax=Pseudomonas syringae pv. actinidiae TaxID=103796 RepID=A0A2V0Q687_PSESF|nr:hypothetical protein KPSA1_01674 [Pseudomonas syringae pv. actinidiae]